MIVIKIAVVVIIVSSIILSGGPGCDEFDYECQAMMENYVIVEVSANIYADVTGKNVNTNRQETVPWPGVQLEITICKAGGEREVFTKVTNAAGVVPELCQATFNVYKEQDVTIDIRVVSGIIPTYLGGGVYNSAIHWQHYMRGSYWLQWRHLEDLEWGSTYYWSPSAGYELYLSNP